MQRLHLARLHGNALGRDSMPQELDGGLEKLAFLQVSIQMMFLKMLQEQAEVLLVGLPGRRVDEKVV